MRGGLGNKREAVSKRLLRIKKIQPQNTSKDNIYLPDTRSEMSEIDTANYDKLRLMR